MEKGSRCQHRCYETPSDEMYVTHTLILEKHSRLAVGNVKPSVGEYKIVREPYAAFVCKYGGHHVPSIAMVVSTTSVT